MAFPVLPYDQQTDSQIAPRQITEVPTKNFIFALPLHLLAFDPDKKPGSLKS